MKAIITTEDGQLDIRETERPAISKRDVLVRVYACGVNRADIMQKKGMYRAPKGVRNDILGLEFAGIIEEKGELVSSKWVEGSRVMGIVAGAAYAQYVVVDHRLLMAIPEQLSMEEAVCIPEVFLTAYDAMMMQMNLSRGDRLLLHAIGSGVGDAAYQLALLWGISVVGTTRTEWKLEPYMHLEKGIVVRDGDFISQLDGQVDAVLDFVGGAYLEQNMRSLRTGGQLLVLGLLGGVQSNISLGLLLVKRLKIFGSTLRSRNIEEKIALIDSFTKRVLPSFSDGVLNPTLDRMFSWREVEEAHRYIEENLNRGTVVLRVSHSS